MAAVNPQQGEKDTRAETFYEPSLVDSKRLQIHLTGSEMESIGNDTVRRVEHVIQDEVQG